MSKLSIEEFENEIKNYKNAMMGLFDYLALKEKSIILLKMIFCYMQST